MEPRLTLTPIKSYELARRKNFTLMTHDSTSKGPKEAGKEGESGRGREAKNQRTRGPEDQRTLYARVLTSNFLGSMSTNFI